MNYLINSFWLVTLFLFLSLLPQSMAQSPTSNTALPGKALFNSRGCYVCHNIQGDGGCLGPPLDDIKARRSAEFVFNRIANSSEAIAKFQELYNQPELMEHPRISPQSAQQITQYLLSLPSFKDGYAIASHPAGVQGKAPKQFVPSKETASSEAGKKLFYERGCISCHSVNGLGGWIGPTLNGVGARLSRDTIKYRISNGGFKVEKMPGEKSQKMSVMPKSGATPKEIEQMTDFLLTLPKNKVQ